MQRKRELVRSHTSFRVTSYSPSILDLFPLSLFLAVSNSSLSQAQAQAGAFRAGETALTSQGRTFRGCPRSIFPLRISDHNQIPPHFHCTARHVLDAWLWRHCCVLTPSNNMLDHNDPPKQVGFGRLASWPYFAAFFAAMECGMFYSLSAANFFLATAALSW